MISSYSLYNGMNSPATVPEFYFQGQPVYRSVAVDSPANQALGVAAGTAGGTGMGMPAGASASPDAKRMMYGSLFSGLIQGLGNAASSYVGAVPQQAGMPNIQPQLASLPLANLGERSIIRG